ncbi:MAG TPA: hypothetical protein VLB76_13975 [Thermoanaerobaculia bacterium]|jgi:hypothetical protein|nr:hypothetical protein [Thermoanaerobaculia bacterium]
MLRVGGVTPERLAGGLGLKDSDAIKTYRRELEAINEAQLDLEKIWHELECFRYIFSSPIDLIRKMKMMSGYLRRILDEYEENCDLLFTIEGSCLQHSKLSGLVASTKDSEFKEKFCDRYSEAAELISKDILRPIVGGGG